MIKKLSPFQIHKAIKERVEAGTGLKCYDEVPENAESPFYFVELVGMIPDNTKTMWCDVYEIWVHAIAESSKKSNQIYKLINSLEEALTEAVNLPPECDLIYQRGNGLQVLKSDETGEKHAVMAFQFKICYGFKIKV